MKKLIALFLVFSVLTISGNLHAKEKRGANLVITKKDSRQVKGELIAVNHDSILLSEFESTAEVSIKIIDIKVIKIIKKSLLAILVGIIGLLEGDWFFEDSGLIPKRCVTIQIEGKTHEEIEKAIKK